MSLQLHACLQVLRYVQPAEMLRAALFACQVAAVACLEARWTPAADGGPARFSKRYRDAQGIDDSRWYGDGEGNRGSGGGMFPSILPSSPIGWIFALMAAGAIYVLLNGTAPRGGATVGGGNRAGAPSEASEAARAAFLRRHADQQQ